MNPRAKIAALMTILLAALDIVLVTLAVTGQFPCAGSADVCTIIRSGNPPWAWVKTSRGDYSCIYNPMPLDGTVIDCYFNSDCSCPSLVCDRSKPILITYCIALASGPCLFAGIVVVVMNVCAKKVEMPSVNMDSVVYTNESVCENSGSNDHTLSRS